MQGRNVRVPHPDNVCRASGIFHLCGFAGTNPVQLTRGMDKTVAALVKELAKLSTEVASDKDLANVAAVSAGRWQEGGCIAAASAQPGGAKVVVRQPVHTPFVPCSNPQLAPRHWCVL
jgi:hypothetical protein